MLARRELLALSSLGALAACDGPRALAARGWGASVPDDLAVPSATVVDPVHRLLCRATFGPWPGDRERVAALGIEGWIDEQLEPDRLDDTACQMMARRFDSLRASPGNAFEWEDTTIREELQRHAVLMAVHSRRQVYESMVALWTDHLNVSVHKGDVAQLAPHYLREVIRPHALGSFRALIRASALSPAMLTYLDGADNALRDPGDQPQENYARELLELHTLGVHGGYTQRDVMEAARCLTGWTIRERWRRGAVEFHPEWHDDGEKRVLGVTIPAGGGPEDLERLLDVVVAHPSTARSVAVRLLRWFVADAPTEEVVESVASTFTATGGDIAATVRAVLTHEVLMTAPLRLKRPFRFVVSGLRALGAITQAEAPLIELLSRMGQAPHAHPTPDGYPLEAHPWRGTMLWRWRFARDLTVGRTQVPWRALVDRLGREPATWFQHLVGRSPTPAEIEPVRAFVAGGDAPREAVSLLLGSPAFQVF